MKLARSTNLSVVAAALCACLCVRSALAQAPPAALEDLRWQKGPVKADVGSIAEIQVPAGHRFVGQGDASKLLEAFGNIVDGSEMGVLGPGDLDWFVVFEWDDCGYVKDDEKDKLNADKLLKELREGNKAGNEERTRRGMSTMELIGWEIPPRYDPQTNNLEWALRYTSEGHSVINFNTKRLGRSGVMSVTLVCDPEDLNTTVPKTRTLLGGFGFKAGQKYAEWRVGDRVAAYGLTGLIAGGAAAVALKTGLIAKILLAFKKLWYFVVVGVVALFAAIKRGLGRVFGRREAT